MLFPLAGFASHPLFTPFTSLDTPMMDVQGVYQDQVTFECALGEDEWRYCAEFSYYDLPVFAQLFSDEGQINQVRLELASSAFHLSQLQFNLRRDGFQPHRVSYAEHDFNVQEALKHSPPEVVDRQLIELINQRPRNSILSMQWVKSSNEVLIQAKIQDDGTDLVLEMTRQ
ncbi:hypothetical protein [Vibrio sp. WXL103]|uniref:hypothetical protein n=1 Tax=Vibrio sp. WXL103 TaxID=3450710 RepID=UPI003EC56A0A